MKEYVEIPQKDLKVGDEIYLPGGSCLITAIKKYPPEKLKCNYGEINLNEGNELMHIQPFLCDGLNKGCPPPLGPKTDYDYEWEVQIPTEKGLKFYTPQLKKEIEDAKIISVNKENEEYEKYYKMVSFKKGIIQETKNLPLINTYIDIICVSKFKDINVRKESHNNTVRGSSLLLLVYAITGNNIYLSSVNEALKWYLKMGGQLVAQVKGYDPFDKNYFREIYEDLFGDLGFHNFDYLKILNSISLKYFTKDYNDIIESVDEFIINKFKKMYFLHNYSDQLPYVFFMKEDLQSIYGYYGSNHYKARQNWKKIKENHFGRGVTKKKIKKNYKNKRTNKRTNKKYQSRKVKKSQKKKNRKKTKYSFKNNNNK